MSVDILLTFNNKYLYQIIYGSASYVWPADYTKSPNVYE